MFPLVRLDTVTFSLTSEHTGGLGTEMNIWSHKEYKYCIDRENQLITLYGIKQLSDNIKKKLLSFKKAAIHGLVACVSYGGVKALRLSDNPPLWWGSCLSIYEIRSHLITSKLILPPSLWVGRTYYLPLPRLSRNLIIYSLSSLKTLPPTINKWQIQSLTNKWKYHAFSLSLS